MSLKAFRERAGITQAAFAEKIGVTQGAVAHYESGRRTPGLHTCRKIISVLNDMGQACSLGDVFPDPVTGSSALAVA